MLQCGEQAFGSRAKAETEFVPAEVLSLRTDGFHCPGDGGGASYRRVTVPPAHAGRLQSGDGA